MTELQKRFAENYALTGNATKSAKMAGYSERTAHSSGHRLLKNVEVADYVKALQAGAEEKKIATMQEVKAFWTETLRDPFESMYVRLRAAEMLARTAGKLLPRAERTLNGNSVQDGEV